MSKHKQSCGGVHIWSDPTPELRQAFEAMREALKAVVNFSQGMNPTPDMMKAAYAKVTAALALADKVSKP